MKIREKTMKNYTLATFEIYHQINYSLPYLTLLYFTVPTHIPYAYAGLLFSALHFCCQLQLNL